MLTHINVQRELAKIVRPTIQAMSKSEMDELVLGSVLEVQDEVAIAV